MLAASPLVAEFAANASVIAAGRGYRVWCRPRRHPAPGDRVSPVRLRRYAAGEAMEGASDARVRRIRR